MADAVKATLIADGPRTKVMHLTSVSDGTGETNVAKVVLANQLIGVKPNQVVPTYSTIEKIEYSIQGFAAVKLSWDHTTDDIAVLLAPGMDILDFSDMGGLVDPKSAGGTGDILLSTIAPAANATYDIKLTFRGKV